MERQLPNGDWPQQAIMGVFNKARRAAGRGGGPRVHPTEAGSIDGGRCRRP